MTNCASTYIVSLRFETVKMPPFDDILVLTHKCPQGIAGISRCMNLLAPDDYEVVDVDHETVKAIVVHRRITKRMPKQNIIEVLRERVFPFISPGEMVRVDFHIIIASSGMENSF